MARTAPTSHTRPATRQSKAEPPAPPPPRSARMRGAKRCNECVASHTRCSRSRPTCERCERRGQVCSWPDQKTVDPTGANILHDPFLPSTTTTTATATAAAMNPLPVADNPALRLLSTLYASYAIDPLLPAATPLLPVAGPQSFIFARPAASCFPDRIDSPEPEEDDKPLARQVALPPQRVQPRREPGVIYLVDSRTGREEPLIRGPPR